MKKLLVLALAAMMLFSCLNASALTPDELPKDYELILFWPELMYPEMEDPANAEESADHDGGVYTVDNGSFQYVLDLNSCPAFLCFTQDKTASSNAYLKLKDPDGYNRYMIEQQIDFHLVDPETGMEIYIYAREGDTLSLLVEDYSGLSAEDQQSVAQVLGTGVSIRKTADTAWMQYSENAMMTICGGQRIFVEFGGSGNAEDDLADTLDVLSHLKLS